MTRLAGFFAALDVVAVAVTRTVSAVAKLTPSGKTKRPIDAGGT